MAWVEMTILRHRQNSPGERWPLSCYPGRLILRGARPFVAAATRTWTKRREVLVRELMALRRAVRDAEQGRGVPADARARIDAAERA